MILHRDCGLFMTCREYYLSTDRVGPLRRPLDEEDGDESRIPEVNTCGALKGDGCDAEALGSKQL